MSEAMPGPTVNKAANEDGGLQASAGNGGRRAAMVGAATGIGSAALLAALLYANRGRGQRPAEK